MAALYRDPDQAIFEAERELLKQIESDITHIIPEIPDDIGGVTLYNDDEITFKLGNLVIKTDPIFGENLADMIHEAFVGMFGINSLKSPNFASMLDYKLKGPCPEWVKSEWIVGCVYAAYEYIEGPTLRKYLKFASIPQLKAVLWELFQALYNAWKLIDFTHYDLHTRNIIIDQGGRPVIIDYGCAHIKYQGKDYGREIGPGGIENRSMWQHDVFKILLGVYSRIDLQFLQMLRLRDLNYRYYDVGTEEERETLASIKDVESGAWRARQPESQLADIKPSLAAMLRFFAIETERVDLTADWYEAYLKEYPYNQVSYDMSQTTYDFDEFMQLAKTLLT